MLTPRDNNGTKYSTVDLTVVVFVFEFIAALESALTTFDYVDLKFMKLYTLSSY